MGWGLSLSEMINPAKVVGFLNIFGSWDPSLAFVMGGALLITIISFRFILKRQKPLFANELSLPTKTKIDLRLIGGAALFGIGWGLSGFCPAPAIASLAYGNLKSIIFILSMLAGMYIFELQFEYK